MIKQSSATITLCFNMKDETEKKFPLQYAWNDKFDFNKLLKTFPFKTYEEKMEFLLSKMNEGQIYNVDEKHLFFKFQFTVTTRLIVNFISH